MLAEYLGPSSLMMIIAKTQSAIDALVAYDGSGNVDESLGLYAFASSRGYSIDGKFQGLALSDIRYRHSLQPLPVMAHESRKILIHACRKFAAKVSARTFIQRLSGFD